MAAFLGFFVDSFSSPGTEPGKARLVTLGFSHFNEKARWALDLSPLRDSYTEDCHPPGLHAMFTTKLSKDEKSSTPLLVISRDEVLQDSTDIIKYLVRRYPDEMGYLIPTEHEAEVLTLISELDESLGPAARRWAYSYLLDDPEVALDIFRKNVSRIEAFLVGKAFKPIARALRLSLKVDGKSGAVAAKQCEQVFDKVSAMLSDGRRYLLGGERPSALDVTFCSLAYPLVSPPELKSVTAAYEQLPPVMQETVDRFRTSRAGQYVLRLYREDRHVQRPMGWAVTVKNKGPRDRVPALLLLLPAILVGYIAYYLVSNDLLPPLL